MSCSQFIEHEDEDKSDTLVIIVNGDGTVTVDPLTLERVLSQQSRAAVSVIRFENTDEPDSQTESVLVNENEKIIDNKEKPCRKVNLVIEGYYPSASLNAVDKNVAPESVVSSTVGTPPLPTRNSSEFLDLLSEELEIPVTQSPTQSNMHAAAGEDTLKLNDEHDDWVHLDHCYTNIYGSRKQNQTERMTNVVVQDSEMATMLTIKVGANDDGCISSLKDTSMGDSSTTSNENLELTMPENVEVINVTLAANETGVDSGSGTKRKAVSQSRAKLVTGNRVVPLKGSVSHHLPDLSIKNDRPLSAGGISQKAKRKSKDSISKNEIVIPERVVTEDEVDGVKVFKPTRNDKRTNKPSTLSLSKDISSMMKTHTQLVQSKLNFVKKLDATIGDANGPQSEKGNGDDAAAAKDSPDAKNVQGKKESNARRTPTPATPETFGPALFSTPDIIRKINATDGGSGEMAAGYSKIDEITISVDQQTADIEKRMSALENGEAILDQLHLQVELQKEMERITSQSDDDKLLSDLENSADEEQVDASVSAVAGITPSSTARNKYNSESNLDFDLDLDLDVEDSENENQRSTAFKVDDFDKSENSDKNEGECEDDPNKLWCLCNKPHNNRFMICCDACDNWFHGKCVGISKAIGEKMEQDGTEWLCPSCRKEKFAKERESKLKMPATKSTASRLANRHGRSEFGGVGPGSSASAYDELHEVKTAAAASSSIDSRSTAANAISGGAVGEATVGRRKSWSPNCEKGSASFCVECKVKETMPNAVYCGVDCVLTYVANALKNMNSGQRIPLSEDRKIIVFDRKSGHRISGFRAPTVGSLNEWLLQHPTFEIDRPSAVPSCRPSYASTFTKPVPKKPVTPSAKSKEVVGMPAVATSVGVVKQQSASSSRQTQTIKSSKTHQECAGTNDGMTQISMKQYVVKKTSVESVSSGAREVVAMAAATGAAVASASTPPRKDDLKSKDKQRQIKIIPVQPLPSKPIEELKEKSAANRKLGSVGVSAVASASVATAAANVNVHAHNNASVAVTVGTTSAAAATAAHPASERKKKPETSKKAELKRSESKKKEAAGSNDACSANVVAAAVPNSDVIRAKIRQGLNELFANKMKESSDIELSEEEVGSLASLVEDEIFALHNKDTGSKYKNKYRQLLFNIKQPQNTLFRRIAVEKTLSPYELVRLTADEMACTELAEWRQREAKHEIDMIKKTELENLQQSKVLVLKTHKGELEIESEPLPPCKPDLIVPDLQPEDVPEEIDKSAAKKTLPYYFGKEKESERVSRDDRSDKKNPNKDSATEAADAVATKEKRRKHHDRKDRHKSSKNRRRSSERDKHGSGSGSGSSKRGKSSHGRSSKSPTKERRRSGSPSAARASSHRSRSAEKTGRGDDRANEKDSRSRGRRRDSDTSPNRSKKPRSPSSSRRRKDKSCERNDGREHVAAKKEDGEPVTAATDAADVDAVVKAEEDEIAADLLNPFKSVDVDLSDMEPTSTVTIKTPPYSRSPAETTPYIWKGTIVMPDVVRVNVVLKQVSGNCEGLDDDLHSGEDSVMGRIDCVGRIDPATVWDYISKVKKSGNKDILVLRFESSEAADQNGYLSFYSYLNTKNRMAVVGNTGPAIKDFYVMPLASHSPIPQILLPLDGPGFEDSRPHLLLAVVVRSRRRKYHYDQIGHFGHHHHHHQQQQQQQQTNRHHNHHRHHQQQLESLPQQQQKHHELLLGHDPYVPSMRPHLPLQQNQQPQLDSFTPPHSPTSVSIRTLHVPVTASVVGNEEDEPYSPRDDEDDNDNNNNNNNNEDDNNNNDDNDGAVLNYDDDDDDDDDDGSGENNDECDDNVNDMDEENRMERRKKPSLRLRRRHQRASCQRPRRRDSQLRQEVTSYSACAIENGNDDRNANNAIEVPAATATMASSSHRIVDLPTRLNGDATSTATFRTKCVVDDEDDSSYAETKFNDDLLCLHGNLCAEENSRKLVPEQVWRLLKKYFPYANEFTSLSQPCGLCKSIASEAEVAKDMYKTGAVMQKEVLGDLYADRCRPQLVYRHAVDADVENVFYLINIEFINSWRKFIRENGKREPPYSIKNQSWLLCADHSGLLYDLNDLNQRMPNTFVVITRLEWQLLCEVYNADCEISVKCMPNGTVVTHPDVCVPCMRRRIEIEEKAQLCYSKAKIYIKVQNDEEVDYLSNEEVTAKPPAAKRAKILSHNGSGSGSGSGSASSSSSINMINGNHGNPHHTNGSGSGSVGIAAAAATSVGGGSNGFDYASGNGDGAGAGGESNHLATNNWCVSVDDSRSNSVAAAYRHSASSLTSATSSLTSATITATATSTATSCRNETTHGVAAAAADAATTATATASTAVTAVRRSSRCRRVRGVKEMIVSSDLTLLDVKKKICEMMSVAPMDQHLFTSDGRSLTENAATLTELCIHPESVLNLKVDEPCESVTADEFIIDREPEAGFKGTGLVGS